MLKRSRLILVLVIAVTFWSTIAQAESIGIIQPFYSDTLNITATLSIDSNGNATCFGKVTPSSASSTTSITVKLRRKISGGSWSQVKKWTASKAGANGVSAGDTVKVEKGYIYQVVVEGSIYNASGSVLERPSKNSGEKAY